jgi:Smg protein
MKENLFDVLIYLFENYMDSEVDFSPDQDTLREELAQAGFPNAEINKAFSWLESLSEQQQTLPGDAAPNAGSSIRVYSPQETERLDPECRGFLMFLEQVGVLDGPTREVVIDRVMALETEEIDMDQLKWVVLMVLFNQPGQEAAFAWMEDLVFNGNGGYLH